MEFIKKRLGLDVSSIRKIQPIDKRVFVLAGLIFIDLIILTLNFYNSWVPDEQWNPFFALANDDSLGEIVQYVKWFSIAAIFIFLLFKRSSLAYLSWALVFTYLLLDDSLAIHENLGAYLMKGANFSTPMGLRIQDIGELLVSGIAGIVLLCVSVIAYKKSTSFYKVMTNNMLILFLALVFFGVVLDVIAVMTYTGNVSAFIFDVIEDGGEMFVASFMFWYMIIIYDAKELPITLLDVILSVMGRKDASLSIAEAQAS